MSLFSGFCKGGGADSSANGVRPRAAKGLDASEADLAVLGHQIVSCEPFTPAGMSVTHSVNGRQPTKRAVHVYPGGKDINYMILFNFYYMEGKQSDRGLLFRE